MLPPKNIKSSSSPSPAEVVSEKSNQKRRVKHKPNENVCVSVEKSVSSEVGWRDGERRHTSVIE